MTVELALDSRHMEEVRDLLLGQFKEKPNLDAFLKAFVDRVQEAENAVISMWTARWIDNATGAQLDGLGAIVGVARGNFDDAAYRRRIRVRIRANFSKGRASDVLDIFALLLNVTSGLELFETYPASFELFINHDLSAFDTDTTELSFYMRAARAAGVGGQGIFSTTDEDHMFHFSSIVGDMEASDTQGYADVPFAISDVDITDSDQFFSAYASLFASSGSGHWVATGRDGSIYSTDNGLTWANGYSVSPDAQKSNHGVVWTGAYFVALFYDGNINKNQVRRSTDGASWSSLIDVDVSGNKLLAQATDGAGTIVAVGENGDIYRSADHGATWSSIETGNFGGGGGGDALSVTWNGPLSLFVATGQNGIIRTSPTGASWTARASGLLSSGDLLYVVFNTSNGGMVVGNSSTADVAYSSNATSWSAVTLSGFTGVRNLVYGDGFFFAADTSDVTGPVQRSVDGASWASIGAVGDMIDDFRGFDGALLVLGDTNGEIFYSIDQGASWMGSGIINKNSVSGFLGSDITGLLMVATVANDFSIVRVATESAIGGEYAGVFS